MSSCRHLAAIVLAFVLASASCGASTDAPTTSPASQPTVPPTLALVPEPTPEPTPTVQPTVVAEAAAVEPLTFPTPESWEPAPQQPIDITSASGSSGSETTVEPGPVDNASADTDQSPRPTYDLGVCLSGIASEEAPAVVPCTDPHLVEVYHVGQFGDAVGSPHPGEEMVARAMEQCAPSFEALPGVAQSGESYEVQVHAPSPRQWENGERFLACLLVFPELVDQPLTEIDRTVGPAALGACFAGDQLGALEPISCQEPHHFQVYAITDVLTLEQAEDFCRRALGDEALFVDFNQVWQADVVVGDTQVDCYLFSAQPTTGSVFDEPDDE